MAVLGAADIDAIWQRLMRRWREDGRPPFTITKDQLRAAIVAADAWADSAAAAYNTALPTAARNGLDTRGKALLLREVIDQRHFRS